jgi:hypothetical protein
MNQLRWWAVVWWLACACAACGGDDDASAADAGAADAGGTGNVVSGTLTVPAAMLGKPYFVRLLDTTGIAAAPPAAETTGRSPDATTIEYSIPNAPPGTYFILAVVDVDESGGYASTPGDYVGWYGHSGDGNPPEAPNAVVPAEGSVVFDFTLVER